MGPQIERSARASTRIAPHRRYFPIPKPTRGTGRAPWRESLYRDEPANCERDVRKFLAIYAHLGILMLVFQQYRIEGRGFQLIAQLAFFGLPIHYVLPYRWKQAGFLGLSLGGLVWVFGPLASAWVIAGVGLCVLACLLPVAWVYRAGLVALMGAGALAVRGWDRLAFVPETVWPVLGSMVMFRSIILLYELKHAKKPERLIDALSYFCLLPNFCFLHFPVVDYRTMQRSYFAKNVHLTQQSGLRMIFRGTVHLLIYRLVYHELLITPAEVHSLAGLVSYLVCNYLLYLHVSGQFHMACGMLHLFGYSLPETHHRFLLATGFTDYWRRINIYWKDFMVRVVFHPIAFRLKRRPQWVSLSVATVTVFLVTWALHAYQSFWLRGTWGFSLPDALFWGVLGVFVLVNVQLDARAQRGKSSSASPGLRDRIVRGAKVAGTFTTIAILWSLWSSPTLGDWMALFKRGLSL